MTEKQVAKTMDDNTKVLESRLMDMAHGVMGHDDFDHLGVDGGIAVTMGTKRWLVWVMAIRKTFSAWADRDACSAPARSVAFDLRYLHHMSGSIEEAARHLWSNGARP